VKQKIYMLLLILMAFSIEQIHAKEPCPDEKQLLETNKIDLDTKTIKGWLRLLNNRTKQGEYGIKLTKEETIALIKCLKDELEFRKKVGKMS